MKRVIGNIARVACASWLMGCGGLWDVDDGDQGQEAADNEWNLRRYDGGNPPPPSKSGPRIFGEEPAGGPAMACIGDACDDDGSTPPQGLPIDKPLPCRGSGCRIANGSSSSSGGGEADAGSASGTSSSSGGGASCPEGSAGLSIAPIADGSYEDGELQVTLSGFDIDTVSWTASQGIDQVIVSSKAATDVTLQGGATSGTSESLGEMLEIVFCYGAFAAAWVDGGSRPGGIDAGESDDAGSSPDAGTTSEGDGGGTWDLDGGGATDLDAGSGANDDAGTTMGEDASVAGGEDTGGGHGTDASVPPPERTSGICHATGSPDSWYVFIVVNDHGRAAHARHEDDLLDVTTAQDCGSNVRGRSGR